MSSTKPEKDADILDLYELFGQTQQLLLQTISETVDDSKETSNAADSTATANKEEQEKSKATALLEEEEKTETEAAYFSSIFQAYDGNWPVDGRPDLTGVGLRVVSPEDEVNDKEHLGGGENRDDSHDNEEDRDDRNDPEGGFFYLEDYFPLQEKHEDMSQLLECRGLAIASILLRRMGADIAPPYVRIRWLREWERKKILECKKKANEARLFRKYEKAIQLYEGALAYFPARMFVAPVPDRDEMVNILSSQAECYLQLEDYENAGQLATYALLFDGQHVKSRVRRAKAELALARIDEELSAEYLVQAKIDLETILVDSPSSHSSKYLEDSPEKLLREVVLPLLDRERIIYYDGYPGGNWELHVKVLEARCWGKIINNGS